MLDTIRRYWMPMKKSSQPSPVDTTALDKSIAETKSEIERHRVGKESLRSKLNLEPTGYIFGDAVIGRRTLTPVVKTDTK